MQSIVRTPEQGGTTCVGVLVYDRHTVVYPVRPDVKRRLLKKIKCSFRYAVTMNPDFGVIIWIAVITTIIDAWT